MQSEHAYDFRKSLTASDRKVDVDTETVFGDEYLSLKNGVKFTGENGVVAENAKKDFAEFLAGSFSIEKGEEREIELILNPDELGEYKGYKGRIVFVRENKITICANDERGLSAGIFDLEILIKRNKAPYVKKGEYGSKPVFSPRMTHSAFDMDVFPDGYLLNLAKEGIDAIIVFVRGINRNMLNEECDINDIIKRANSFGIDVYAYCVLKNFHHPEEENAEKIFDDIYGKFYEAHAGLKGMIFVGESVEFPSKDPHVSGVGNGCFYGIGADNIPEEKPSPGFWPCYDYPAWLDLIKKSIRKRRKDAEIIFWTYNWGYAPEEDRVKLIKSLPSDVILLTTYETFQKQKVGKAVSEVCDYTISVPTAGEYFESEARAAKEKGIKLYTMSNTAGKTWDFGVVPYLPVPYQYKKRYDEMLTFSKKYGLSGVMESHHYGLTPSFISRYEKYCFETGGDLTGKKDTSEYLKTVLREFYGKDAEEIDKALKYISDSINYYIPGDEVQYTSMRIGTAYPLCLSEDMRPPEKQHVYFGLIICQTMFKTREYGRCNAYSVRSGYELKSFEKMLKLMEKGVKILDGIEKPNLCTQKLINLVKYMRCCVITTINTKRFYRYKCLLMTAVTNGKVIKYANKIKEIAYKEMDNARESLSYLDKDSALGYEPSMGYAGGRERVEWKIKQVEYMINRELKDYFDSVKNNAKDLKIKKRV